MNLKMQIKGLSQKRRLPRLGKIRLGVKVKSEKSGATYPKETDYFVVPSEVARVYGERPKEIDILFPLEDNEAIVPQAYEWYGSSQGLKCIGNGVIAYRLNEETRIREERVCPCEKLNNGCSKRMHIQVILPRVNLGGVYQIDTSSINSIIDINSGLDFVRKWVGRVVFVPLILKRTPTITHKDGKSQTHYTLKVEPPPGWTIEIINKLRSDTTCILTSAMQCSLAAPKHENPEYDDGAVIEKEVGVKSTIETEPGIEAKEEKKETITVEFMMAGIMNAKNVQDLETFWKKYSPDILSGEDRQMLFKEKINKKKSLNQQNQIKEEKAEVVMAEAPREY